MHARALVVITCPACSRLSGALHVWIRVGANVVVTLPTISLNFDTQPLIGAARSSLFCTRCVSLR